MKIEMKFKMKFGAKQMKFKMKFRRPLFATPLMQNARF